MNNRIPKLSSYIQMQIARIIEEKLEKPDNMLITVTDVKATGDSKEAFVLVSILPEKQRGTGLKFLRKTTPIIQAELGKVIRTKFTPKITFKLDEREIFAADIDKILDEIKEE